LNIWPLLAVLGVVNLAVGIIAIVWPGVTLTVVGFLFGIQLLVVGGLRILLTLAVPDLESRWLSVLIGVLTVVVGLLVMRDPLRTLEILVVLIGILWVIWGLIGLVTAVVVPSGSRTGAMLEGAVSLIAGAVILAWPDITLKGFTVVVGISLVVIGATELFAAYETRNLRLELETAPQR
jgi:uncharacterized membrane protein HdeD (DUF308 family)